MPEDLLRYDKMVEQALRNVVREAVTGAAKDGLPGEHHFYISFLTEFDGVEIPDYLREQYPEEMTIVLQYQFFGLKVEEDHFSVTLSFNNVREKLRIPFAAITTFADPAVNFALQFQGAGDDEDEGYEEDGEDGDDPPPEGGKPPRKKKDEPRGEVISLDNFRKKPTNE
ncbi:MAG: hypothetical protein GC131_08490 [Alphaproteobacteria bacterium]|nr:hypothetical protein [Alphaproteobacteria bacterium]